MWIWMALASAVLLGVYDVAKKSALKRNGVYFILLLATALSALFVSPFLTLGNGPDHLRLIFKAVLVTASWVSGMIALQLLPITTVSTFKTSRPMFVVLFSILLFGERLNWQQWLGVAAVLLSLWLLSVNSEREGISFKGNKGFWALVVSIFTGVASALWDKHIMSGMQPLFVQSWTNIYITLLLALIMLLRRCKGISEPVRWDWTIVLIAILITGADMLYFFSLKEDGALLSVISLIRRSSVIITFALGAALFKEKRIAQKAGVLLLMLAGVTVLMVGSL
ncbi:MAG: DMT family transporter [Bacteroidales bacterium]|nr:DMT family transporter [Bacteroidales bacterium]